MSGTATIIYRCPSCSARAQPDQRRCLACGFQATQDECTWILESGDGAAAPEGRFEQRYELIEEIGRGGMGIVYKAIDRELDEVIALKVLAPAAGANPDLVARFKHEVKVARRLTHPNVARLHDLVEIRGQLCLSMEFIEGRSLREVLADGPLDPARVLHYLRFLAPALDLAHGLGIVHRDLKPGNVLVDPKDVPHILDFGIAKSRWLQEQGNGNLVGTPPYMAPEQWGDGVEVDGRADLYSFGVMLYEMVCGQRPFLHKNRLILMEMHRSRAPKRPRALNPAVSEELEAAILKLLEKDPSKRFARAMDILAMLEPPPAPPEAAKPNRPSSERTVRPKGAIPPVKLMPGRKGKVLIADDDPLVRKMLRSRLKGLDLVVLESGDGAHAVETAFREVPDLILLDLRMPVLDGLEALRLVKNNARTRDVPVIMMSGVGEEEHVTFAKDLGAASFLDKPIPAEVLGLLIERYFG